MSALLRVGGWANVLLNYLPNPIRPPDGKAGEGLAGWGRGALRPIHDRFIGYVLRWGLAGLAIYAVMFVAMGFLDDDRMSLQESLFALGSISGIWALIGAGVWIKDRFWGKLAKR